MPTIATGCRTCASAACRARPTPCRTPPSAAMAGRRACSRSRPSSTSIARHLGLAARHRCAQRNFYGIGRNNVTPYGMTVEDNIIERVVDELDRTRRPRQPGARERRRLQPPEPGGEEGPRHHAGEVRHLVQPPGAQPGRRAGARLYRRQRDAEPRRHRDGAGPVHQGRAGGGRGVPDRPRQYPHHRRPRTGKVPNTSPTAASSGSDLNGMAALQCRRADQGRA